MKSTLLVYSSNGRHCDEFRDSLEQALSHGASVVAQRGTPDVALARNFALTMAVRALHADSSRDVVLMVDDDVSWAPDVATLVLSWVRQNRRAASAAYVGRDGNVAARYVGPRWLTGLGFLAVPREQLLGLAEQSELFCFGGKPWVEFTRSGVVQRDGERGWLTEDFFLTQRLGGVELLPYGVDHIKSATLRPSAEHLAEFVRGVTKSEE